MGDLKIRKAAVAGMFYPENEGELKQMVEEYLGNVEEISLEGKLRGLVVPHAGYIYSGPVAAYGYSLLAKQQKIKKIVLIGPSHNAVFNGVCEAGFDFWETPLGKVRAKSIREKLKDDDKKLINVYPQAHSMEHCLEVQLPFLQVVMKNEFEIYPLLTGNIDAAQLADIMAGQLDDNSLVIVSSDLSHYLPYDTAKKVDSIANESVPSLDIERFEGEGDACGKTAILTLMHIAVKKEWKGKLLEYKNSGDTAGPKTGVVGYGCYAFHSKG
jgi:AmmeMemoRadiSam system protein B